MEEHSEKPGWGEGEAGLRVDRSTEGKKRREKRWRATREDWLPNTGLSWNCPLPYSPGERKTKASEVP